MKKDMKNKTNVGSKSQNKRENNGSLKELKNENNRLINIINASGIGTWEWNVQTGEQIVNETWASIVGYTLEELTPVTFETWTKICHSDDFEKANELLTEMFENDLPSVEMELRVKHKDGGWLWILDRAKVVKRDNTGTPLIVAGSFTDITVMKMNSKKLEYERNLAQKYLDVMATMIIVLNPNGEVTMVNKKGCEILKATENEIIGKNWFDNYLPQDNIDQVKEVFKNVFSEDNIFEEYFENYILNSKGERIFMQFFNSMLYDENQNLIGVICAADDMSERKRHEEQLINASYTDALTELNNRRYFEETLVKIDSTKNLPITVAMGDINGLKLINDAFGHTAGDDLLIKASQIIKQCSRENDLVARIGGDEFALVMPNTTKVEAEKIITKIRSLTKNILVKSIPLSISFGLESKFGEYQSIQDICISAEDAMYREKLLEIPSMRSDTISTIIKTLHEKDGESEIHSKAVSVFSEKLAIALRLSRLDVNEVKTAALLHDIGKIIISSDIINKEGLLSHAEYETIKGHSEIGFRILNSTQDMRGIASIVLNHHERWDGKGYPRGIKGKKIPLKSRIISVADAFDAMVSTRKYKKSISKEDALQEIIRCSGTQFDPEIVTVFKNNFEKITNITL